MHKSVRVFNVRSGKELLLQTMKINITNLNFQNDNSFDIQVDDFSEIQDNDLIELRNQELTAVLSKRDRTIPETVFFKGVAKVKLRKTDRIGNKFLEVALEFPFLRKREFKKVILKDEFFLDKFISNPAEPANSILNIIAENLGFDLQATKFQEAISYYQAGLNPLAKVPFALFKKGDRWIDELTTLLDSINGYLFVNHEFKLVYNSYLDLRFKELRKVFSRNEIHKMIPYRINPGTNNGVKLEFDRFEMEEEVTDVFKADKKVFAKVGEKFNLKLKYITDIVLEPAVKSCEVYYYNGETPIFITDYSEYVKFDLNGNNGELIIDNSYSKDIYVDKVVIEGKPLMKYLDNSTILKNKSITETLQEDFLNLGKNKYIQSFYMSRSKAVESYYSKVKDSESLEIIIEFSPLYEPGDKVQFEGTDYCVDRINHTFDSRNGYNTKLSLIPILNPDFLNIIWKETETLNKAKPSIDLDVANGLIDEKVEQSSKDVLDSANGFTEEMKQKLENQLAKDVESLEGLVEKVQKNLDEVGDTLKSKIEQTEKDIILKVSATENTLKEHEVKFREQSAEIKVEADKITQEIKDRTEAITETEKKVTTLNTKIESTAEGILQEVSKANTAIKDLGTEVSEAKTTIKQTSESLTLTAEKVSSNDTLLNSGQHLISKINIAPEGISIDAKKVSLGNGTITVEQAIEGVNDGNVVINGNTRFNGDATIVSVGAFEETKITGGRLEFKRNGVTVSSISNIKYGTATASSSGGEVIKLNNFNDSITKVLPSLMKFNISSSLKSLECRASRVGVNEWRFFLKGAESTVKPVEPITTTSASRTSTDVYSAEVMETSFDRVNQNNGFGSWNTGGHSSGMGTGPATPSGYDASGNYTITCKKNNVTSVLKTGKIDFLGVVKNDVNEWVPFSDGNSKGNIEFTTTFNSTNGIEYRKRIVQTSDVRWFIDSRVIYAPTISFVNMKIKEYRDVTVTYEGDGEVQYIAFEEPRIV